MFSSGEGIGWQSPSDIPSAETRVSDRTQRADASPDHFPLKSAPRPLTKPVGTASRPTPKGKQFETAMTEPLPVFNREQVAQRIWWNAGLKPPSATTSELGFVEMFYAAQSEAQKVREASMASGHAESASMPLQVSDALKFARNRGAKSAGFIVGGQLLFFSV